MKSALWWTFKTIFKGWLTGALVGLLVGFAINLGHYAPEGSSPGEMVAGAAVAFSLLGFVIGTLISALRGAWWVIQVFRGKVKAPSVGVERGPTAGSAVAGTGVAVISTVGGSLLVGIVSACYGTYWWGVDLANSNPGNSAYKEWLPLLMTFQLPIAFMIFGVLGALAGAIAGFLGGGILGAVVANFRPVVKE